MITNHLFRLILVLITIGLLGAESLPVNGSAQAYEKTRKLLSQMSSVIDNEDKLAKLFAVGDKRIADLIRALDDSDSEISLRAQIVIRYLGNEQGMNALRDSYKKSGKIRLAGPIPLPLNEWDYNFLDGYALRRPPNEWSDLAVSYIFALALDGSPRAKAVLDQMIKLAHNLDESTYTKDTINQVQGNQPGKLLTGTANLADLVLANAFFVNPQSRKYTTARLLGFNAAKDKALIEVYINRGPLAEEWFHVVIRKVDQGWKFFSVSRVAIS